MLLQLNVVLCGMWPRALWPTTHHSISSIPCMFELASKEAFRLPPELYVSRAKKSLGDLLQARCKPTLLEGDASGGQQGAAD